MASVALDILWASVLFVAVGVPAVVIGWRARSKRKANRPLPKTEELYRKWLKTQDPADLEAYARAEIERQDEEK
jgi:hypothetical protein